MSSVDILVPDLPESVADATVATWHKKPGDAVVRDEVLVEIETDKVVLEVPASADGILDAVLEDEGTTVTSRQILGRLREGNSAGKETSAKAEEKASTPAQRQQASLEEQNNDALSPAIRRLLAEHSLDPAAIKGTGVGGRLTREDIDKHLAKAPSEAKAEAKAPAAAPAAQPALGARSEKRVPMTRLRKRVAERLLEAKNSTAMLTTFNEIDMKPLMDLRNEYKDAFEKKHKAKLGFMSLFVKAAAVALQRFPEINASIDGNDVVYHGFCDIGIAVSSDRGLVVPILRNTENMGLADIESGIAGYAAKAREGKLDMNDLSGGTFTITNGGVFGSLLSTPILNPPQSAILGMHSIQKRPVVVNDQIVIRPMMYVALSYDHRIVDGQGAVTFLKTIKELVENPVRLVLDV